MGGLRCLLEIRALPEGETGKLTSEKMTLEMLCMQVCLGAVGAGELSVRILSRDQRALASTRCRHRRSTWSTWQDTSSTLRAYNVGGGLHILHHLHALIVRVHSWLHLQAILGHWTNWLICAALYRSWSNCLRMGDGHGGLRHHGGRRSVLLLLLRLLVSVGVHQLLLVALLRIVVRHLLGKVAHVVRGDGSARSGASSGSVRRTAGIVMEMAWHGCVLSGLEGRQCRVMGLLLLELVGSDCGHEWGIVVAHSIGLVAVGRWIVHYVVWRRSVVERIVDERGVDRGSSGGFRV